MGRDGAIPTAVHEKKIKVGIVPIPINFNEVEIGAIPTAVHEKKIKVGIESNGEWH